MTTAQDVLDFLGDLKASEKLQILEEARYLLSVEMKMHPSKLTNGTQSERVICEKLELKWNSTTIHGCDAWDSQERLIEIKTFKEGAQRTNVNYKFPERKKNETIEHYANRIYTHFDTTCTGGHIWALVSPGGTVYRKHWYIDGKRFALAMKNRILEQDTACKAAHNFGGILCKTCKSCHRIDEIARILNDPSKDAKIPTTKIQSQCNRRFIYCFFDL